MLPHRAPPVGFFLLGMMIMPVAAFTAVIVLWENVPWLARLLAGGVATLSVLLIEGLWRMRPWLGRAVDAWAIACPLALVAAFAAAATSDGSSVGDFLMLALLVLCFVGTPCALVRRYVRSHAAVAGLLGPLPGTIP